MSDLREQLARRLAHVTHANPIYPEVVYDQDWELYLSAADEVIRQMEWARRECVSGHTLLETEASGAIYATKIEKPLTPAPKDWTP